MTNSMFENYLKEIEQKNKISVLYCCEAGSRAWGFPSPDSDFDIRFIYALPLERYLRLTPERDSMDWFSEDRELDFSGWELRKALNLFAACNPAFNEQLGSPTVYSEKSSFGARMREWIPIYFNPARAFQHYLSIATRMVAENPLDESIRVKAFFYVIRPLHACQWIWENASQPPTAYSDLLKLDSISETGVSLITELIERKKSVKERDLVELPAFLVQQTRDLLQTMTDRRTNGLNARFPTFQRPDTEPLESFFRESVLPEFFKN